MTAGMSEDGRQPSSPKATPSRRRTEDGRSGGQESGGRDQRSDVRLLTLRPSTFDSGCHGSVAATGGRGEVRYQRTAVRGQIVYTIFGCGVAALGLEYRRLGDKNDRIS